MCLKNKKINNVKIGDVLLSRNRCEDRGLKDHGKQTVGEFLLVTEVGPKGAIYAKVIKPEGLGGQGSFKSCEVEHTNCIYKNGEILDKVF